MDELDIGELELVAPADDQLPLHVNDEDFLIEFEEGRRHGLVWLMYNILCDMISVSCGSRGRLTYCLHMRMRVLVYMSYVVICRFYIVMWRLYTMICRLYIVP